MTAPTRRLSTIACAAFLITALLAATATTASADERHVPRAHHYEGVDRATGRIDLTTLAYTLVGHGHARLLGRTSSVVRNTAADSSGQTVDISGEDGDAVHLVFATTLPTDGVVCPPSAFPGKARYNIRGGARRFARATGSVDVTACNFFTNLTPTTVDITSNASIEGTIVF
jgi:hypothetical protein